MRVAIGGEFILLPPVCFARRITYEIYKSAVDENELDAVSRLYGSWSRPEVVLTTSNSFSSTATHKGRLRNDAAAPGE